MVAAGKHHVLTATAEGDLFTWGMAGRGRLGHGIEQVEYDILVLTLISLQVFAGSRVVVVAACGQHSAAVTAKGSLFTWGSNAYGQLGLDKDDMMLPTLVRANGGFDDKRVRMAACGNDNTLIVMDEGTLWSCGKGLTGVNGLGDNHTRFSQILVHEQRFDGAKIVTAVLGHARAATVTEESLVFT